MQSGLAWREPTSGEKFICIRGASRLEMLQDSIRFGLPWYTFSRNFARPNAITELRAHVHVCSMRIFGGRPLKSSAAYVQRRRISPDTQQHKARALVGGGIACQRESEIAARNVPLLLKRGVISHSAAANAIKVVKVKVRCQFPFTATGQVLAEMRKV